MELATSLERKNYNSVLEIAAKREFEKRKGNGRSIYEVEQNVGQIE